MPEREKEPDSKMNSSAPEEMEDMGGARSGKERRQKREAYEGSERRSGRDRRRGFDRRSNHDRRRSSDRRFGPFFREGDRIERREAFRKLPID
jgi:hypothetical protein